MLYVSGYEAILRELDNRLLELDDKLLSGGCSSWEDYRETVGRRDEVIEAREIVRKSHLTAS